MTPSIRVALVEDNARLREQLAQFIAAAPGFACVGACADAATALATLPAAAPEVVLMDIRLPGMSGVECVARLKARLPEVKVVMLTAYDDSETIFQALENGASGYLLKRTPPADLLRSIQEVQNGGAPMIKVGTPVARRPPRRSRRAELPHRAPLMDAQVERWTWVGEAF